MGAMKDRLTTTFAAEKRGTRNEKLLLDYQLFRDRRGSARCTLPSAKIKNVENPHERLLKRFFF
jgi:hypothetical protein